MIAIAPFRALLPPVGKVAEIAAVPYDVVDRSEARQQAEGFPLSFLRVSRSELELADSANAYSDEVYALAAANLAKITAEAPLGREDQPCLYAYSQVMDGHRQTGLVVAAAVDDYDADRIKKHEKTRKQKEDDRTAHTMAIRAHTGPVFLACRDNGTLAEKLNAEREGAPLFDFTAPDGVLHQVWRLSEEASVWYVAHFEGVDATYVADGHHRAKCASRVREACRAANPNHTGAEAYNRFLAVIFPGQELAVLAYNRIVHDLNGHSHDDFLAAVTEAFDCSETIETEPDAAGCVHMYLGESWYALTPREAISGSPAECLDVSVLQDRLLSPLLSIDDPRTNDRIEFIGGIHGTDRLVNHVESGRAAVAFSMYPVSVEQLMAIADCGEIMPPKSTWFEPKLRDGLVLHTFG